MHWFTQMVFVAALVVFMAPTMKLLYLKAVQTVQTDTEEYEDEGSIYIDDFNADGVEVEMPIIIHNKNKTLFPFDDMPQGVYEYSEDVDPDSGIYSDEREVCR